MLRLCNVWDKPRTVARLEQVACKLAETTPEWLVMSTTQKLAASVQYANLAGDVVTTDN